MDRRKNSNWLVKALAMACGAISIALMTYANTYATDVSSANQNFYNNLSGWLTNPATMQASSWLSGHRMIIGLGEVPSGSRYFSGSVVFEASILANNGGNVNNQIGWYLGTTRGINASNLSCYFSTGSFWTVQSNKSFDVDFFVEYHGADVASPSGENQAYYSIQAVFHGESSWSGGGAANFVCQLYDSPSSSSRLFYQVGNYTTQVAANRTLNGNVKRSKINVQISRDATDAINNVNSTLIEGFGGLENKLDEIQQKEEDAGNEQVEDAEQKSDEATVDVEQPKMQLDILLQLVKTTGGSCSLGEIEAYGFNIGEIDMCTYTPPDWTRTAVSAVTSLALIYGYLHAFRRIIDTVIRGYTR